MFSPFLTTWNSFFACRIVCLDYSGWMSRPEKKCQNSWMQAFDWYIVLHSNGMELKKIHFTQVLFNSHWAADWPPKSENWELEIQDRSWRSSYGWLVNNTVDDCLQRQIAQKNVQIEIKACPVNTGHYMAFKHHISFAINLAANFGCNWFRIMPDIFSKLLLTTIWSIGIWANTLSSDRLSI